MASFARTSVCVVSLAAATCAAWLPALNAPLSPDEGGYLAVASQWEPGSSLYGDYWVDRPPVLIGLFALADVLGGTVALRLIGVTCVALTVLLAGTLGALASPRDHRVALLAAATAAVLTATPLFGAGRVNGELLALPFVLGGLVALVATLRARSTRGVVVAALAAGALGVGAACIKQNVVDVAVAALVVTVALALRSDLRRARIVVVGFSTASVCTLVLVCWWAASRGTDVGGLLDAVVAFRAEAAGVIAESAPGTNGDRAARLAWAFVLSGAAALLAVAVLPHRCRAGTIPPRDPADPVPPVLPALAAAVLGWETVAVIGGGSYWLHYLLGVVPGLVLTVVAVAVRRPTRTPLLAATLGYAAAAAALTVVLGSTRPEADDPADEVARYLAAHAEAADTAVTGFGNPAILRTAGLSSPYPHLWSLPVRVRDPGLEDFTRLLRGPARPDWVVVSGRDLATWGIDATTADAVLDRRYRLVHVADDWHVHRVVGAPQRDAAAR